MPRNSFADYSQTASDNIDIGGISIAEGCPPSNLNNADREHMKHHADHYTNDGQKFAGDVGIGTAPSRRLHVLESGAQGVARFESTDAGNGAYIDIKASGTTTPPQVGATSNDLILQTGGSERARVDANGNFLVGAASGASHVISKAVAEGTSFLLCKSSSVAQNSFVVAAVANDGYSGAASALYAGRNTTTGRTLNGSGTFNASGADYAEYVLKCADCGEIAKGALVGVDAEGKLTDRFADAHSFVIKSTDPAYVGGDTWGSEDVVGKRPVMPAPVGDAPEAPVAPSLPEAPVRGEDDDDAMWAARRLDYERAMAKHAVAVESYAAKLAAYPGLVAEHTARVAAFNAAKAAYDQELPLWEARLEAARQTVDRIAFSGQVPANVTGALPGQFIVAREAADGGIYGEPVNEPALVDLFRVVGKVWKVLPDGRAWVAVKIA